MVADECGERFLLTVNVGPIAAEPLDGEPAGGFQLPAFCIAPGCVRIGERVAGNNRAVKRLCCLVMVVFEHRDFSPENGKEQPHRVGIGQQFSGQELAPPQLRDELVEGQITEAWSGVGNGRPALPGHEEREQRPEARLQPARGLERDQGTETVPEQGSRRTTRGADFIGYVLGGIVN